MVTNPRRKEWTVATIRGYIDINDMNPSAVSRYKTPNTEPIAAYMTADAIKPFVYRSILSFYHFSIHMAIMIESNYLKILNL